MKKLLTIAVMLVLALAVNAQVTVTFNLDMSVENDQGNLSAGDTLSVNGTFNNWAPKVDILTDGDGDFVYTGDITANVGDTLKFKFWWSAFDGQWEPVPDDRVLIVNGDTTATYFWNNVKSLPMPLAVTFQCNMEYEIVSGRFDPATDTLTVRGGMNGWGAADILEPNALDPNLYELTISDTLAVDEEVAHKFAYITSNGTAWENDPNHIYSPTAADFTAGFLLVNRTFNDATEAELTVRETTVTFEVDMNGAVDANGIAFAQIDNVIIAGASAPLAWPSGGWPDADSNLVHFLADDGVAPDLTAGDNIWTVDLVFPKYSLLGVEYKYGANFGTANNGGSNDNEGGVGANHWIFLIPELWTGKVSNVFGDAEGKDDPHTLVGVEQEGNEIPVTFAMDQNYPNPFNPSTTIKFAIPRQDNVTLKVYNMLGQEVATLVNEQMGAGNYTVNFDASNLSSGIYFYSIQTGQFNSTKKMMLIK